MSVWTEFSQVLDYWNKDRTKLTDLLSFRTDKAGEAVPQNITPALLQKGSQPTCCGDSNPFSPSDTARLTRGMRPKTDEGVAPRGVV
jgi:hypothetical protein